MVKNRETLADVVEDPRAEAKQGHIEVAKNRDLGIGNMEVEVIVVVVVVVAATHGVETEKAVVEVALEAEDCFYKSKIA